MLLSVLIGSYGAEDWKVLARERAYPSALAAGPHEVIVRHYPQANVNAMRNDLAGQASGDWLCFLDADDELHPNFVSAMHNAVSRLEGGSAKALLTPAWRMQRGRRVSGRARFHREVDLRWGNWLIIGTLIRREFFHELGGFRDWPHGLEDWDLWARAHYAGAVPVKVPGAIYVIHQHQGSSHAAFARNKEAYQAAREAVLASHQR